MSSTTWTTREVASNAASTRYALWRAVEAQHLVSTMALVDSIEEQHALERLLDSTKPSVPADAAHLHWLLFTPFRYPPPPGGSRFRGPNDPGVFYGADVVRTACAELGYWRWRHLRDSPALSAMPAKPQTVFRARIDTPTVDLRGKPFVRDRLHWTDARDYAWCQRFGRIAREASVGAIRYESVRDPEHAACCAVLIPAAFASPAPREQQTWLLSVTRERVIWQRMQTLRREAHEFAATPWEVALSLPDAPPQPPRRHAP